MHMRDCSILICKPHDICSCTMQVPNSIKFQLYYFHDITIGIYVLQEKQVILLSKGAAQCASARKSRLWYC